MAAAAALRRTLRERPMEEVATSCVGVGCAAVDIDITVSDSEKEAARASISRVLRVVVILRSDHSVQDLESPYWYAFVSSVPVMVI